tara:strand:+ start:167 stop:373 length:207 start_codon:yes stop_codon:yes gene_type:complete
MQLRYKGAPKSVLKVFAKKSKGLNRKDKVKNMLNLLSALACSYNFFASDEIGAIEKILNQAKQKREAA